MGGPRHEWPELERLKSPRDFKAVYQAGRSVAGKYIVLYYVRAPGEGAVGYSTARSISTAVARNRARRVLREAWKPLERQVARDVRIVLLARPGLVDAGWGEVTGELSVLLSRAGLGERGGGSAGPGTEHEDAAR